MKPGKCKKSRQAKNVEEFSFNYISDIPRHATTYYYYSDKAILIYDKEEKHIVIKNTTRGIDLQQGNVKDESIRDGQSESISKKLF